MKRIIVLPAFVAFGVWAALPAIGLQAYLFLAVPITKISTDPFTNSAAQHQTEAEPDTFANGMTVVSTFQQGRFATGGGATNLGWATSTDGGKVWAHGSLPGTTKIENPNSPYDRISDPTVAFDAKHGRWLISGLPIRGTTGQVPTVSGSNDGLHWEDPVKVAPDNGDFMDKDWLACDSNAGSPHEGNCYVEWDDASQFDEITMSTSRDGGHTWSTPFVLSNLSGLGGQPLAQPNGTVVVPYLSDGGTISAFRSSDGGKTWGGNVVISAQNDHFVAGNLRTEALPSAQMDGAGKVYVAWQDCAFRSGCSANDIVLSSSSDGVHWLQKLRVPIDPVTSAFDHFIPGIGVDRTTSGTSAHLGLTYYFYPNANCSVSTCQLNIGYIASKNGGLTWTRPTTIFGPMHTTWLANTDTGYFVGDYIATAFVGPSTHSVFAVATAPSSKFNEFMASTSSALPARGDTIETTSIGERPIPGAHSDHPRHRYPPLL